MGRGGRTGDRGENYLVHALFKAIEGQLFSFPEDLRPSFFFPFSFLFFLLVTRGSDLFIWSFEPDDYVTDDSSMKESFLGDSFSENVHLEPRASCRPPPAPVTEGRATAPGARGSSSDHPGGAVTRPVHQPEGEDVLASRSRLIIESLSRFYSRPESMLADIPHGDARRQKATDLAFWEILAGRDDLWEAVEEPDWDTHADVVDYILDEVQGRIRRYDQSGVYWPPLNMSRQDILERVPFSRQSLDSKFWPADSEDPWGSDLHCEGSGDAFSLGSRSHFPNGVCPEVGREAEETASSRQVGREGERLIDLIQPFLVSFAQ